MSKEVVENGLFRVQSLVDKLSLTERKQLSIYLQQHLTKDIISLLPIPLASHLLEFLDAENLCKIRQGIYYYKMGSLNINSYFVARGKMAFIYLFVVLYCINKNDDHT